MWSHGWGGGGMIFWWIIGFAIIAMMVWMFTRPGGGSPTDSRHESPEQILKSRYARGEINEEQYRRMLRELRE